MNVRYQTVARKGVSCVTIATLLFSLVSPVFAAVAPSFVALETVANSAPVNNQTATTVVTQPATSETKASRTITVFNRPVSGSSITVGQCVVSFQAIAGSTSDELDCGDNIAIVDTNTGPGDANRNAATLGGRLRALSNVSDANHGSLSTSGGGANATFTTSGNEISATDIAFADNTAGDVASSANITGVLALPKISTITIANVETGDQFIATFGGGNSVTVTATNTSADDVAGEMNTQIQNHVLYPTAPFTSSVSGNTITFTGKTAGTNFAQSSSTTNAPSIAQVVTFTPADPVGGVEYQMTINGNTTAFATTSTTVADITAGIIANYSSADVSCVDNATHITCTAIVAGIAFTYATNIDDTEVPVITLTGMTPVTVEAGSVYTDDGATASDNVDGDITAHISTGGTLVDTNTLGSFTVTYDVSDAAGNPAVQAVRTIDIVDTTAPTTPTIVSPLNNASVTTAAIDKIDWTDSTDASSVTYIYSVSSSDATNPDGTFVTPLYTSGVLTASEIPTPGTPEGVYYFSVKAVDASVNESPWTTPSKVTVDNTAPVITVDPYTTTPTNADVTVTASTNEGTLNQTSYTFTANGSFTFTATDDAGNVTNETITITNIDKMAPVITLNGSTPMDIHFGDTYTEPGANCTDNVDPVCTVTIGGATVVTSVITSYVVTYDATDAVGNAATQQTRTINVIDADIPVITLLGTATVTVAQNSVYTDAGATALDNVDGDITTSIVVSGSVDTSTLGDYILTYDVSDAALNAATQVTRTVTVADLTAPTIAEVTPVSTPTNDNTPNYTFSTDEAGTISYAGGCSSATTMANVGNNTIELNLLADGTYATCTITVTDAATVPNTSAPLTLSTFTIDITDPSVTIDQATTQGDPTATSTLYFTAVFSEAIVEATFDCSDILLTNAICTSITPAGANNYTVQVQATTQSIVTAVVSGGTVSDFAGNTNTESTSVDNAVTFIASGGGGSVQSTTIPNSTDSTNSVVVTNEDNSDTNDNETTEGESTDDVLISDDDENAIDNDDTLTEDENDDFITPPSPETNTDTNDNTDLNDAPAQSTSYPNNALPPRPLTGSVNLGTDETAEAPIETTEPQPVDEATTEIIPETPVDIGGGVTPEDSSSLPWVLLALIAILNFAWFYTRKETPTPPSNNPPA